MSRDDFATPQVITLSPGEALLVQGAAEPWQRRSYVYGIRFERYTKIGHTVAPAERFKAVRRGGGVLAPDGLDLSATPEIVFVVSGDETTERLLHVIFAGQRAVGEWFQLSATQLDALRLTTTDSQRLDFMPPLAFDRVRERAEVPASLDDRAEGVEF